jgi:hypothetical protein
VPTLLDAVAESSLVLTKCRTSSGVEAPISVVGTIRIGTTQRKRAIMNTPDSDPKDCRSVAFTVASQPSEATRKGISSDQMATPSSANAYAKIGCLMRFA